MHRKSFLIRNFVGIFRGNLAASIWWIRKDLRVEDNRALNAALACGLPLVPLFILDPILFPNCPEAKKNFLLDGLQCLDMELRRRGSRLILRAGKPVEILSDVLSAAGGGQIFAGADYSSYALRRDRQIARGLPITFVKGDVRIAPPDLLTVSGRPFQVFTPFARAWRARPELFVNQKAVPDRLPAVDLKSLDMPTFTPSRLFPAGEKAAGSRLAEFTSESIFSYSERRDRPDLDGTSRLSPYLHMGMVSAERAVQAALTAERTAPDPASARGASTWLN
jgi:deoxyribodipyrimidine photo-lyase